MTLQRSLGTSMNDYCVQLIKSKKQSPFMNKLQSLKAVQARIYYESDHLLPEEQWAQITVKLTG